MSKKIIVLLFTLLTAALPVFAWDDAGHKVTAFIAWEQMTPETRETVFKILSKAPEDSDLFSVYNAWETRSDAVKKRELFMFASIWGDVIRNRDFPVRYAKYNQGTWHYADVFWRQNGDAAVIIKEMSGTDSGGKAIPKLYEFAKILKDPQASDAEKSIALAWFLHVGGDIHNPLHNASRVTDLEPEGDQGGNLFMLSPKDAAREDRLNLHSYWDQIITREMPRKDDWCDNDYIASVAHKLTDKFPYSEMKDYLKIGDFESWHKEGFAFLPKNVYAQNLERNQMPPESYQKNTFIIGQEQLALAGYRLGETLNQIFDTRKTAAENAGSTIGDGANDLFIWTKTRAALAANDDLRDSTINVDVECSVVTLRGSVKNKEQKQKAIETARQVEGVRTVNDQLKIGK